MYRIRKGKTQVRLKDTESQDAATDPCYVWMDGFGLQKNTSNEGMDCNPSMKCNIQIRSNMVYIPATKHVWYFA